MSHTTATRTRLGVESLEAREVPAILYGVTNAQRLLTFDSANPAVPLGSVALTGLTAPGERVTDIDVRVGGGLYGRSDQGRLYLINTRTGRSTQIGGPVAIGASVGMDFDPVRNNLRVVNNAGGNVAVNPSFGSISSIGGSLRYRAGDPLAGRTPNLAGIAFTNSVPLAFSTQLFGIDYATNTLAVGVGVPNTGVFRTVGPLGLDVTDRVGFDIDPALNVGYVTVQRVGTSFSLFGRINLATGRVSVVGKVGPVGALVLDVAVARGALGVPTPSFPTPTGNPFPTTTPLAPPAVPPFTPPQPFPTTGGLPFPTTLNPTGGGSPFGPFSPFGGGTTTFGGGLFGTGGLFGLSRSISSLDPLAFGV
ncbi:Uncharacterized protein OS=Singulisphaera acidiphila (strain ATCC BAA-1392 / DSM 18658 / VKM B-2454 / MOB10) GN=Sinac_3832 PE=4 SV=1: DUF4394 [Gemmataceae bacterium]|nr:Uncharacterized protein OS=Singulisphaera acidiphila (strain ATCC BAA-1392 / DSM 18658 / VKM B-2454 / MOB10) GN=Sinac_3832 PE=4 SV=1: DUF4394 [Gemmataceae bacterium]VTU02182.1 Uncharacterized protein OS=Singulisphaera acidiphila (strain ATCC BAA-1392 / DSM 18658 / VKM B-2454 / MOB10) GN=Sinac_3832 PE=4 SV=1: DUF4394 [Gemmataceae bacterium]